MNILVYGAGVIGSYLCHVLCANGHSVSLVARGQRKAELEQNGLVIRHYLQRKTTVDHPQIIEHVDPAEQYHAVFTVMQHQQMLAILDNLAAANARLVVLVGNNMNAPAMQQHILNNTKVPKQVLFGFQPTGGRREAGGVVCVRKGAAHLSCGFVHSEPDASIKALLAGIFTGKYAPVYTTDMDGWYKCHLAFILPVCFLCYRYDCNLTKVSYKQLGLVLDAVREAFALLTSLEVPILPAGGEAALVPGAKRTMAMAMLWIIAKTPIGRLAASDHCRNAVSEMAALDAAFEGLRRQQPDILMPIWHELRDQMPSWQALEQQYKQH